MASPARPADFSLARTAVIASALAFCASRDVLARDSAEIATNARSGARLTVASPLVTTTGKSDSLGADVCAVARLAQAIAATAAVVVSISMAIDPPGWTRQPHPPTFSAIWTMGMPPESEAGSGRHDTLWGLRAQRRGMADGRWQMVDGRWQMA